MSGPVHIDGLLHLAAITVVATAAYIGIDRVRQHRPDSFQRQLERVRSRVHELLLRLDVKQSGRLKLKDLFDRAPVHILCHVAAEKIELGMWRRCKHLCHRQWFVPILGYFRKRADLIVVAILTVLSFIIFLALSAASIWGMQAFYIGNHSIEMPSAAFLSFIILTTFLVWIFVTVALSYRLQQIDKICKSLEATSYRRILVMTGVRRQRFELAI